MLFIFIIKRSRDLGHKNSQMLEKILKINRVQVRYTN